jgi:cell division protein FtsZ
MKDAGYAHMGIGIGNGKDKAEIAAKMAVTSPLLESSISGATGILINITASHDISLDEVETASAMVSNEAHPEATIIWGLAFDEKLDDTIKVTVIATGFQDVAKKGPNATDTFSAYRAYSQPSMNTNTMMNTNSMTNTSINMNQYRPAQQVVTDNADTLVPSRNVDDLMHILNQRKKY